MPVLLLVALLLTLLGCADPAVPAGDAGACGTDVDCAEGAFCDGGRCVEGGGDPCAPATTCAAGCVDLSSDPAHCGGCDAPCGERGCVDGACCPAEAKSSCGGRCVDPASDASHCGGCGVVCGEGLTCTGGACCTPGAFACGGACRDLSRDPFFCGGCEVRCPLGAACVEGACAPCPAGSTLTDCAGVQLCASDDAPAGARCMAEIPAGSFDRGDERDPGATPVRTLQLSRFFLDRFEVTRGDYRACVTAGGCTPHDAMPILDEVGPNLPIGWALFAQAEEFCRWRGARLPTEAEWERAARGEDDRAFPWGEEPTTCRHASVAECGRGPVPVGSLPDGRSPYGVFELAGNAAEWVDDWFVDDWYARCPAIDPPSPERPASDQRLRRGRGYTSAADRVMTFLREPRAIDELDEPGGFRCALTPP